MTDLAARLLALEQEIRDEMPLRPCPSAYAVIPVAVLLKLIDELAALRRDVEGSPMPRSPALCEGRGRAHNLVGVTGGWRCQECQKYFPEPEPPAPAPEPISSEYETIVAPNIAVTQKEWLRLHAESAELARLRACLQQIRHLPRHVSPKHEIEYRYVTGWIRGSEVDRLLTDAGV